MISDHISIGLSFKHQGKSLRLQIAEVKAKAKYFSIKAHSSSPKSVLKHHIIRDVFNVTEIILSGVVKNSGNPSARRSGLRPNPAGRDYSAPSDP